MPLAGGDVRVAGEAAVAEGPGRVVARAPRPGGGGPVVARVPQVLAPDPAAADPTTLPSPPTDTAMGSALLACSALITSSNVWTSSLCSLRYRRNFLGSYPA